VQARPHQSRTGAPRARGWSCEIAVANPFSAMKAGHARNSRVFWWPSRRNGAIELRCGNASARDVAVCLAS